MVRRTPAPILIQKRLLARKWVTSSRWRIASVNPFSPKLDSRRLKVVTMVTTPKSAGVSSRARTTVAAICTANDTPWAKTITPAPRTAVRRSPSALAMGWKAPLESKGFNCCLLPGRGECMTGRWLSYSASALTKRLPCSAAGTGGGAVRTNYGEKKEDPYRIQHPEASLSDAVHRSGGDICQHQTAERTIPSKSGYRTPITADQNDCNQTHADPPEVEVNLDVTVVRFVDMHVLRKVAPHPLQAWWEPEAFEPGANNPVWNHGKYCRPDFRAPGQVCFSAQCMHDARLAAKQHGKAPSEQNHHNECMHCSRAASDQGQICRKHQHGAECKAGA